MSTSADMGAGLAKSKPEVPWNRHVHQSEKIGDRVVEIVMWATIAVIVAVVVYPLWFVVIASFSNPQLVSSGHVTILPKGVTFAGYLRVFADDRIWHGYMNTVLYSVVGTAVNLVVTIPAAFALSRHDLGGRRIIMFLFTFTMYFAGGLIPNYLLYKSLGLLDNWLVFILPGAVSVWNLIIARSFFETSIPEELHDAAQLDGMGYFGYFMRIVIPLSSAIIAVLALYYFVGHWNDYFTGLVFINDDAKRPLQNVLQSILLGSQTQATGTTGSGVSAVQQQQLADQIKYGVMIVSTAPLLIVYPFVQKYFNKGVMIGAVKG